MFEPNRKPWERRTSYSKAPDYSAKQNVEDVLSGAKKTFKESHYQPAQQDSLKRCSECKFYKKPGNDKSDCDKVIGVIEADGYCDLFIQKDYRKDSTPNIVIEIRNA